MPGRGRRPPVGGTDSGGFVPEVGTEVLVEFVEGDPDRPVGRLAVQRDRSPPDALATGRYSSSSGHSSASCVQNGTSQKVWFPFSSRAPTSTL